MREEAGSMRYDVAILDHSGWCEEQEWLHDDRY